MTIQELRETLREGITPTNHDVLAAIGGELERPDVASADRLRGIHALIIEFWPGVEPLALPELGPEEPYRVTLEYQATRRATLTVNARSKSEACATATDRALFDEATAASLEWNDADHGAINAVDVGRAVPG